MSRKKGISIFVLLMIILNIFIAFTVNGKKDSLMNLNMTVNVEIPTKFQVYYKIDPNLDYSEALSVVQVCDLLNKDVTISFDIPVNISDLRIDFGESVTDIKILSPHFEYMNKSLSIPYDEIMNYSELNMVENISLDQDYMIVRTAGNDSYSELNLEKLQLSTFISSSISSSNLKIKMGLCIFIDLIAIYILFLCKHTFRFLKEIVSSHKLILNLAKNDFKTKYAGSYFGIIWAFVQPVVTVLIYVFVFQVAFKAAPLEDNFPYVLWLIAGLIPWFFFGEATMSSSSCLVEYSYLVKKVVFKISVLPIVKILSSLYVHLFFVALSLIIYILNGYFPTIHMFQIIYYISCNICFVLALSFLTASIQPFFKDFSQIVNILIQIGMWLTPIMWNKSMLPDQFHWILRLNPMFYIVEGYRDTFINHKWFWEKDIETIYFWGITFFIMFSGFKIFGKLKDHFSDVL